jgi:hypothetical protein
MMEEKFRDNRIEKRKHAAYFAMRREMDREQDKEKWEERARKSEKARHAKKAYAQGGKKVLIKGKWPCLTQD